jgi:nitroreductase
MNFLELVKTRQSVRSYSDIPVEKEKLMNCLEASRLSPSACNSQPWRFIVVDEPELREKVARSTFSELVSFNKFSVGAPVLVVVTASKGNLKTKVGQMITDIPYYLIDIGVAAEHFCLQAAEEGLGTCMMGWFKEKEIKKHLSIPKNERVALVISVGYPKTDTVRNKNRKPVEEISTFNITNL